jgi:hypothetical protein
MISTFTKFEREQTNTQTNILFLTCTKEDNCSTTQTSLLSICQFPFACVIVLLFDFEPYKLNIGDMARGSIKVSSYIGSEVSIETAFSSLLKSKMFVFQKINRKKSKYKTREKSSEKENQLFTPCQSRVLWYLLQVHFRFQLLRQFL